MILFAVFLVLAVVLYVMREPLYRWLTRLGEPEKPAGP
jgi:predicted PurR-regulated permease PerM